MQGSANASASGPVADPDQEVGGVRQTDVLRHQGIMTTPPNDNRTKTLPPTVNQSRSASRSRAFFHARHRPMFNVSKGTSFAVFALHSKIARPTANVQPRARSPFVATRVS